MADGDEARRSRARAARTIVNIDATLGDPSDPEILRIAASDDDEPIRPVFIWGMRPPGRWQRLLNRLYWWRELRDYERMGAVQADEDDGGWP